MDYIPKVTAEIANRLNINVTLLHMDSITSGSALVADRSNATAEALICPKVIVEAAYRQKVTSAAAYHLNVVHRSLTAQKSTKRIHIIEFFQKDTCFT